MIPISRIPNDEKIFGLFPHFCFAALVTSYSSDFFSDAQLQQPIFQSLFSYAKNDAKIVSILFSGLFSSFLCCGRRRFVCQGVQMFVYETLSESVTRYVSKENFAQKQTIFVARSRRIFFQMELKHFQQFSIVYCCILPRNI